MIEDVDVREPAVNSDHCTIHFMAHGASTSKEQP